MSWIDNYFHKKTPFLLTKSDYFTKDKINEYLSGKGEIIEDFVYVDGEDTTIQAEGDKGADGATWHTGEQAPASTLGENGDFYYDSVSLKIYYKNNNVWTLKSSLGMKDILKIEKLPSDEGEYYKITYTDGTTDEFLVDESVDLLKPSQEELFEKYLDVLAEYKSQKELYMVFKNESKLKDGEIQYENYFNGGSRESTIHVYSVTKSIVSILIGIAIDKGCIKSVNQKVLDFFPDYIVKKRQKTKLNLANI